MAAVAPRVSDTVESLQQCAAPPPSSPPPAAQLPAATASPSPPAPQSPDELRGWLYAFFSAPGRRGRLADVERLVKAHGRRPAVLVECLIAEYDDGDDAGGAAGQNAAPPSPAGQQRRGSSPAARRANPLAAAPHGSPRRVQIQEVEGDDEAGQSPLHVVASPNKDGYVARIVHMYRQYAPDKLHATSGAAGTRDEGGAPSVLSRLLARYEGHEVELLAALVAKYGPEPHPPAPGEAEARTAMPRGGPPPSPHPMSRYPPPDPVQIEGLVQALMAAHQGPLPKLMGGLVEKYGPEPVATVTVDNTRQQRGLYSWESRLQRFIAVYWEDIARDSAAEGAASPRDALVGHHAAQGSPSPSPSAHASRGGHRMVDMESIAAAELDFSSTVTPVIWSRMERLDPRNPFPYLRLPPRLPGPGREGDLIGYAPLLPLELTRHDAADLPSLVDVQEPIRWLSRALIWDEALVNEPSWRHVALTDRAILFLSMHDRIAAVVPLPGADNAAATDKHLQVEVTVFEPSQQCAPSGGVLDASMMPLLESMEAEDLGNSDDVCVVSIKVAPSRVAAHYEGKKSAYVKRFEEAMRDVRNLSSAEGVAQQALLANIGTEASATIVFPGRFLAAPRFSAREAIAADSHRPPLQRALGASAGRRFACALSKLVVARCGGPEALNMRELSVRCDVAPPGFSYVREVGSGLGYRLDRSLLASHVRQAVLRVDEATRGEGGGSPRRRSHRRSPSRSPDEGRGSPRRVGGRDYDEL
jgi:hypothetical protein